MISEYLIANIIITTIAVTGYFYVYKKTQKVALLAIGTLAYSELLFKYLEVNMLYFVPLELLCLAWLSYLIYQQKSYWILILVIIETIIYLYFLLCGYKFYGTAGLIFMLLLLLWYNNNKEDLCNNPFECE